MLYCRGLQAAGYQPTLYDVTAACFRIYESSPVVVNQVRINR